MKQTLKKLGPAYKLAHTTARQAKLRGISDSDLSAALITQGLMIMCDLDAEKALLPFQSCSAYANSLLI